jgi:hypothetical protein
METRRAAYLVSATVLRVCECLAGVWRAYSADVRENSDITPLIASPLRVEKLPHKGNDCLLPRYRITQLVYLHPPARRSCYRDLATLRCR